jgi:hypothetical protein
MTATIPLCRAIRPMRMSARVPRTIDESALGWLFEADGDLR